MNMRFQHVSSLCGETDVPFAPLLRRASTLDLNFAPWQDFIKFSELSALNMKVYWMQLEAYKCIKDVFMLTALWFSCLHANILGIVFFAEYFRKCKHCVSYSYLSEWYNYIISQHWASVCNCTKKCNVWMEFCKNIWNYKLWNRNILNIYIS